MFMISRFRTSILKSHEIFSFISDRFRVVFLYVCTMIAFMMLPFVLIERTEGVITSRERIDIISQFKEQVMILQPVYEDGKLKIDENFSFQYAFLEFSNQASSNPLAISVNLLEDEIQFFIADVLYENITYEQLIALYGTDLDLTSFNPLRFASLTVSWLNDVSVIQNIYYIALTLSVVLEYVFITFIFTVMMRFNKKQTVPFRSHFKVGLYLTSIYAFSQLFLMLFQVYNVGFLSFLLTYIVYFRAHRLRGTSHE